MANYVIMAALAVVILLALRSALKHFRGEGGCCGGGAAPAPSFKAPDADMNESFTIKIGGMKCANCAARVQAAINTIDGVSARVSFSEGTAVVRARSQSQETAVRQAVVKAGYQALQRC